MDYEKALWQTEALCDAERARLLRVRILKFEDDNNDLLEQLTHGDDHIEALQHASQDLQYHLNAARSELEDAHHNLRLKSRETETLKVGLIGCIEASYAQIDLLQVELNSLREVTMDSTKLLTEKLALARELSSLKPEVDHLRSQAASHQATLAEKLSLQRQLSALQVEFETEKRATDRAVAKKEKMQEEDARSLAQLDSLQAELAKEQRERSRIEREAQKASADWDVRKAALESRLDSLKHQMKATKDQLKRTQSEVQKNQAAARSGAGQPASTAIQDDMDRNSRKRNAARMDDDTIIGTPGDLQATKKGKRGSTLLGDKSTFSITPFLNRTASLAPDSPNKESQTDGERNFEVVKRKGMNAVLRASLESSKSGSSIQHHPPESGSMNEAKRQKPFSKVAQGPNAKKPTTLERVTEEACNEGLAATARDQSARGVVDNSVFNDTIANAATKKRQRKLLGGGLSKTLLHDEDGEAIAGGKGAAREFGTADRVPLGRPRSKQEFGLGTTSHGFGAFSPLKKDRKAAD